MEEWKDIKGYEGYYQISNLGNARSLDRKDSRGYQRKGKGLRIKYTKNTGYATVSLSKGSEVVQRKIHRLVAEHFIPNPENKTCVNHKNGNKKENEVRNLEWTTSSENNQHAYNLGLRSSAKGEKHGKSKLTNADVLFIRENYKKSDRAFGAVALAGRFGVKNRAILDIISNKTWKHI